MLGRGVYVSKSYDKAQRYGPAVIAALVYPGYVCKITTQNHPMQKAWHSKYDSAWVPPGCGMVDSGLEVKQDKILILHCVTINVASIQNP